MNTFCIFDMKEDLKEMYNYPAGGSSPTGSDACLKQSEYTRKTHHDGSETEMAGWSYMNQLK